MKFCKKYQEYVQGQEKKLPGVGFKKLKKILKKCRRDFQSKNDVNGVLAIQTCPQHCPGIETKVFMEHLFFFFSFPFLDDFSG